MKAKMVFDDNGMFYGIRFNCPGCAEGKGNAVHGSVVLPVNWLPAGKIESPHVKDRPHWAFNGDFDSPTFGPSVLTKWNQYTGEKSPPRPNVCHSFINNGRIQFLGDCTHSLAGKTVDLPEIE